MRTLLIAATLAYRLIPCRVRGLWLRGGSTSHLALAGLRNGEPHGVVVTAVKHWFDRPGQPGPYF